MTWTESGETRCDMVDGCTAPVTHLDTKGYVYCTPHGLERRQY